MNLLHKKKLITILDYMNKKLIAVTIGDIDGIGIELLINLWRLRKIKNVVINTPIEKHKSCGIANVGIKNMDPGKLSKILLDKYQIFTVAINHENVVGCRISPNVYTNQEDLEHFITSIKELAI